jgi:hypothetical protein
VPASAPYGAAQLLNLSGIQINGGAVAAQADAGLHLVGYLGDATGNGLYSSADAQRALRASVGLDAGFPAYPLIDPLIVADVTANGMLNAADATRILQEAIGIDQAIIPNPPAAVPPTVTLRAGDAFAAEAGSDTGTFTFTRTGSTAADLVVNYLIGGTADNGGDYALLPGSITIPANAASAVVTVAPLADALAEGSESVILTLAPGAAYTVSAAREGAVTLADALPPAGRVTFGVIGDFSAGQPLLDVSNLIRSWNPDFIATVGDNNYPSGAASTIDANIGQYFHDFIFPYLGGYGAGATVNRFFPALGNHDWDATPPAGPYLDYFTLPGNERYYDVTWGPVHLFIVDSDAREPDGISGTSVQAQWLRDRLAASSAAWKIVLFHHSPYSSGSSHGSSAVLQWPFQAWGADAVLTGHDHDYERLLVYTLPFIVDGLGGRSITGFSTVERGSQVRYNGDYGALRVDANNDALTFQFLNRQGQVIDSQTLTHRPQPVVSVFASDPVAAEPGANTGTFTFTRTGYTDLPLTVAYTVGGTATAGADYTPLIGSVTILAGASSATVTLTPLNDTAAESAETVTLTLAPGADYAVGVLGSATVRILDDDSALLPRGSIWRYLDDGSNQGTAWRNPGFNDLAWRSGPAQLGYGDGDEATVVSFGPDPNNKFITTYFRTTFTVTDAAAFTGLLLRLVRDDGAVVYLNGTEVLRSNMPTGAVTYTTLASTAVSGADENRFFETQIGPAALVSGMNTLAVEIHQVNATSSDIGFDLEVLGVL